jgi:hypothetical protein
MSKSRIAAVVLAFAALSAVAGCSSSYQIEAPDQPVAYSMSFEIEQQISVVLPNGAPKAAPVT